MGRLFSQMKITFSSSSIINQSLDLNSEKRKFLKKIYLKNSFVSIKNKIEEFKKLNVLIIGEAIIDEYVFCETIGKSGKEPILVLKDVYSEKYLGGSLAIANNIADFCKSVSIVSIIGEKGEYEKLIHSNLKKNIKPFFIKKKSSPTIIKKRYVDYLEKNKILGVYTLNDDQMSVSQEKKLKILIKKTNK